MIDFGEQPSQFNPGNIFVERGFTAQSKGMVVYNEKPYESLPSREALDQLGQAFPDIFGPHAFPNTLQDIATQADSFHYGYDLNFSATAHGEQLRPWGISIGYSDKDSWQLHTSLQHAESAVPAPVEIRWTGDQQNQSNTLIVDFPEYTHQTIPAKGKRVLISGDGTTQIEHYLYNKVMHTYDRNVIDYIPADETNEQERTEFEKGDKTKIGNIEIEGGVVRISYLGYPPNTEYQGTLVLPRRIRPTLIYADSKLHRAEVVKLLNRKDESS